MFSFCRFHFGGPQPHNLPGQGKAGQGWRSRQGAGRTKRAARGSYNYAPEKSASNSLSYAGIDANCVACYKMHAGDNKPAGYSSSSNNNMLQLYRRTSCCRISPNLQECEEAENNLSSLTVKNARNSTWQGRSRPLGRCSLGCPGSGLRQPASQTHTVAQYRRHCLAEGSSLWPV